MSVRKYVRISAGGRDHILRSDEPKTLCGRKVGEWAMELRHLYARVVCDRCADIEDAGR